MYCKGPDYKIHKLDITGEIKNETKALNIYGRKVEYTDDITSSSSSLINEHYTSLTFNQKNN